MTSFLFILAGVAFIGFSIWSVLDGRSRVKRTLDSTFREQRFSTPQGVVTGEFLRVVKIASDSMPFAYDNAWQLGPDHMPSTSFWYCVGPGPSYFLALPMLTTHFRGASVKWIIRPLSEDRMRAVLRDDEGALRAAFGDPIGD